MCLKQLNPVKRERNCSCCGKSHRHKGESLVIISARWDKRATRLVDRDKPRIRINRAKEEIRGRKVAKGENKALWKLDGSTDVEGFYS